jgi:hypothetical protein
MSGRPALAPAQEVSSSTCERLYGTEALRYIMAPGGSMDIAALLDRDHNYSFAGV